MSGLTILGASARAAAFSAARGGFAPYTIDSFADRDLVELCPAVRIERYPQDFPRALAAAPAGPWMYTGGLENHPRVVARMGRLRTLWGNPAEVLAKVRDPWQLSAVLSRSGLAYPPLARSASSDSWLVKPRRGSAGLDVRRLGPHDWQSPPRGAVLQKYIEGESGSAVYVAAQGAAVFLGATRQLVGRDFDLAPEFLYVGSIGPLQLNAAEQEKLRRLGSVLAEQFRLVGLFGVDFIRTAGDIWTVEVNPRYTASVEICERTTGARFIALHAAACRDGMLPERPPKLLADVCAGKAVVYARRDSLVGDELPFDRAALADLPPAGQRIAAGHPVVTVFAEGSSLAAVEATLRHRSQQVLDWLRPAST